MATGNDQIGADQSITTKLPYGTVCEVLDAFRIGMEACKPKMAEAMESNPDAEFDLIGCVEGIIGMTYDQSVYFTEYVLTNCDNKENEQCCDDAETCWNLCKVQVPRCISDEKYAALTEAFEPKSRVAAVRSQDKNLFF